MLHQRLEALKRLFEAHCDAFARQGTVVKIWRTRHGRRSGPYYRLQWREGGRLRTHYLGSDKHLADVATRMLDVLRQRHQRRQFFARQQAIVRRMIREHKAQWRQRLEELGLTVQGREIRGWRKLAARKTEIPFAGRTRLTRSLPPTSHCDKFRVANNVEMRGRVEQLLGEEHFRLINKSPLRGGGRA